MWVVLVTPVGAIGVGECVHCTTHGPPYSQAGSVCFKSIINCVEFLGHFAIHTVILCMISERLLTALFVVCL